MKKACISFVTGCPRSMMDATLLVDYFKKNDWKITTRFQEADIILAATCGFCVETEEFSLEKLKYIERKKRNVAPLITFGCLPGINEARLLKEIDTIPATRRNLDKLDKIIDSKTKLKEISDPNDLDDYTFVTRCFSDSECSHIKSKIISSKRSLNRILSGVKSGKIIDRIHNKKADKSDKIFHLKIASGCNGACSYCAIKESVGPFKSKPMNKIIEEFEHGLSMGYKSFCLIAEDVGAYGKDIGTNIVGLFVRLLDNREQFKLSFDDFSPKWLLQYFPELYDIFAANETRFGYFGLPIQSGSDKILSLMRREYSAEPVKKCMKKLQKVSPGIDFDTHILIGFPGETEEDFLGTIKFFQNFHFRRTFLYKYSDRPNTAASKLTGKVQEKVKEMRKLRLIQMKNSDEFVTP